MSRLSPALFVLAVLIAVPARAELPLPTFPGCGEGGACPSDYDPWSDWWLGSGIPSPIQPESVPEDERHLGSGNWVDRAWGLTTGRTDVLIAVMDSGIQWTQGDLINKFAIRTSELPEEAASDDPTCVPVKEREDLFDCNGDGVVNIRDWDGDSRLLPELGENADGHADDILDPSDLIALWSDGVDDDGNGYTDDIAGWDFFWNDNNPYDESLHDGYSHGSKEGRWSVAEGSGAGGAIGSCPNCMGVFLRVSDSFVADTNNFAQAVLYAVDNDVAVIQEALGSLNNTQLTVDAIEYAWDRGVPIVASAADETSWHANFPGANHHTIYVHAIRHDATERENTTSWLAFSNCTNYGGRLQLSVAAEGCSSGATGVGAGIAGLIVSAMRDAVEEGTLDSPLSSNEIYQLMRATVDDVAVNPNDDDERRYPSREGWDAWFGYGRTNALNAVQAVYAGEIPPEADITSPDWFVPFDPVRTASIEVQGRAAAPRSGSYTWSLQVAAGMDPLEESFEEVATGGGSDPVEGRLAEVDITGILDDPAAAMGLYDRYDTNVSKTDKVHAPAVTLRLQVTDAEGRLGEMRKMIYLRHDPQLLPGYPRKAGHSIEASPNLADVDGDGRDDLVYATSDGTVHVENWDGTPHAGWPRALRLLDEVDPEHPENHLAADAFRGGEVTTDARHTVLSSPAVGDLDGDGPAEVIVASMNGDLWVFRADGSTAPGWPYTLDESLVRGRNDRENIYDYGFFSSPALGDLDGDGDLEVVIGAMDSRVYVFDHDGTFHPGFPLELRTEYEDSQGNTTSRGERIISSPAVADIDGDGRLEIVIGTNQKTTGTYGLGYAISHDGQIEEGWPAYLFGAYTNALPMVGEGVPGSPTVCDVDGDGTMEVAMHTIADAGVMLNHDGTDYARMARIATDFGFGTNSAESGASLIMINSGAWGDMDGDDRPDYLVGAMGFEYATGLLHDGRRYDHDHLLGGWSGAPPEDPANPRMAYLEFFPRIMEDMQFFLNPTLVDLNGDGFPEAINGSAGGILHAFDYRGREPEGWPKHLGQWILGTPMVGDVNGNGLLEVWTTTRSGWIYAWETPAVASEAKRLWNGFHHDPWNTGNCHTPLREYPPIEEVVEDCSGCESRVGGAGVSGVSALLMGLLGALGIRRRR